MNSKGSGNTGILKLWLAKLTHLAHDKNTKLKEAAVTCIISVYSHFDSAPVLNFILSLSVEEQNSLRRALKQYTPRIEVDLMNKKERTQTKSSYDPSDAVGTSSEEGFIGASRKNFGSGHRIASDEAQEQPYHGLGSGVNIEPPSEPDHPKHAALKTNTNTDMG